MAAIPQYGRHPVRVFIKAERTVRLHLQALLEILHYLGAAGHNLYTKSARLYSMTSLETDHSDVYRKLNLKQDFTLSEEATSYGQDYQWILS